MVNVNNTTQYSTFELIRDIIRQNSTLANIFSANKFLEFDQKVKAVNFVDYPYIIIRTPKSSPQESTLKKEDTLKEFKVSLEMRNDYFARSVITTYVNLIVKAINDGASTLKSSGYKLMSVENLGVVPSLISQQDIFITTIEITLEGIVSR